MIMMLAGLADRARPAAPRRAGRRRRGLAALLAHHRSASQGRHTRHGPAAARHEPELLHHPLDHDRGGPAGASEIWITQIYQLAFGRTRFGVASAYSVILFVVHDVDGLLLCAGADARRREEARDEPQSRTDRQRAGIAAQADATAGDWRVDFPRLLCSFASLPMVWMLITSIKTQFAAVAISAANAGRSNPTLENTGACCSPPAMSGATSSAICSIALGFDRDHRPRRRRGGARGLRLLAVPLSRAATCCSTRCCCATCFRRSCS